MDPTMVAIKEIRTRIIRKFALTSLLTFCVLISHGMSDKSDSLRFEILMSSKMLKDIHLEINFIKSIDITPERHILLSSNNQFYLLGWGAIIPFGGKVNGSISSYAYTPDSLLMVIKNKEICTFDSTGQLSTLLRLPNYGMSLSAGKYAMYVYDNNNLKSKNALYVIVRGGKYAMLFEDPTPILSVAEMKNLILFSSKNVLYSLDPKNKVLKKIAALPDEKEIESVAVDTSNNRIFFSSGDMIYSLKDSIAVQVTNQFGGVLRYFDDGLIVFNPEKKFLIRILGLKESIASLQLSKINTSNNKPSVETLANQSIIQMVEAKLSDEFIIKLINKSDVNFDVGVDAMISLSNHNVSSAVIMAMKNAMKNKTNTQLKNSK